MIQICIEDNRNPGKIIENIALVFTGFRKKIVALTDLEISADPVEIAPQKNGGVGIGAQQDFGNHAGCGALSVRAGYGDRLREVFHQRPQHHTACNDGDTAAFCRNQLFVLRQDCIGIDHQIRILNILRFLSDCNGRAFFFQSAYKMIAFSVRARNRVAFVQKKCRDPTHANAADSDEMNGFHRMGIYVKLKHASLLKIHS